MEPFEETEPVTSIFLFFVIFPTQIFLSVCLFWGLLFNLTELVLFSLLVLSISIGTYLWSLASPKGVKWDITASRTRLFPGEDSRLTISIVNDKFLPVLVNLRFHLDSSFKGGGNDEFVTKERGLLWYQAFSSFADVTAGKRGVYNLVSPLIRFGDIFGIHTRKKNIKRNLEIIVFPRLVNVRPVSLPKREFHGMPGSKSPVEDPLFIFGTRDYVPGRPARYIHWKASARHNRLQEKICEPAEHEKIFVVLDVRGFYDSQGKEAFEKTLEVIASTIINFYKQGFSVGFATNGNVTGNVSRILPISRSEKQISSVLELLARLRPDYDDTLENILTFGCSLSWGVSCFYFSYDEDKAALCGAYFKERRIPVSFVFFNRASSFDKDIYMHGKKVFRVEDLLIREKEKN